MPGSTQAQLRAAVRQELRDEDATAYVWTDAVVNRHVQDAIQKVQRLAPKIGRVTSTVPASPQRIDLSGLVPTTYLWLEAVEYLVDQFPQQFIPYREEAGPKAYLLTSQLPIVGDAIAYWYAGAYTVNDGAGDMPTDFDTTVVLGATAFALRDQAIGRIPKVGPRDMPTRYGQDASALTAKWEQELAQLASRYGKPLWQPYWNRNPDGSSL